PTRTDCDFPISATVPLDPQPVPYSPRHDSGGDADRPERVQRHRLDARYRHIDLGVAAADETARELTAHRGRERDAAAVAAERDQEIFRRLVHMGIMIRRDREPAVPAVGPARILQPRP